MLLEPWGSPGGAEGMSRLLDLPRPPTAVVAFSDEMAFGVLRTLRRAAVPVPDAVSVVGIDDHAVSEMLDLTTVRQPVVEQGRAAGNLVRQVVEEGGAPAPHLTLPTELIVRGPRRRRALTGGGPSPSPGARGCETSRGRPRRSHRSFRRE